MNLGLLGGIIGSILGIAGGLIGTYFSIKNTQSPLEKAFMIKASIYIWLGVLIFLALLLLLPRSYQLLLWILYAVLLPTSIITINKKLTEIKRGQNPNQQNPEKR